MKKARQSCFVILFLCPVLLMAQKPWYTPQRHEVSLYAANVNSSPKLGDYYENLPFGLDLGKGLRYTFHLDLNNSFRLGFTGRKMNLVDNMVDPGTENYSSEKSDWLVKLGYERKYHTGPFQYYAGVQGIMGFGREQGLFNQSNQNIDIDNTYDKVGASLFIGSRWFLHKNFSTSLEVEGYYERNDLGNTADLVTRIPDSELGINASLILSYHFKKMPKRCTCPKVRR